MLKLTIDITVFGFRFFLEKADKEVAAVVEAEKAPSQVYHVYGSFEPAPAFFGYADNPQGDSVNGEGNAGL